MTPEEINAAIQKSVAEALKPITTQLATLGEAVKPITTLQEQVKTLTETDSAATISGKGKPAAKGGKDAGEGASGAITADAVAKMVSDGIAAALKTRDETSAASAAQQAAIDAYIEKHAPKLKGNPLAKRLFSGTKTDDERKVILDEYVASVKASGAKAPDLGATAAGEGGKSADADSDEAKKAAALEAAKGLKPVAL